MRLPRTTERLALAKNRYFGLGASSFGGSMNNFRFAVFVAAAFGCSAPIDATHEAIEAASKPKISLRVPLLNRNDGKFLSEQNALFEAKGLPTFPNYVTLSLPGGADVFSTQLDKVDQINGELNLQLE